MPEWSRLQMLTCSFTFEIRSFSMQLIPFTNKICVSLKLLKTSKTKLSNLQSNSKYLRIYTKSTNTNKGFTNEVMGHILNPGKRKALTFWGRICQ